LIFKVKVQGHRVNFLGEGIRDALPLFVWKKLVNVMFLEWSRNKLGLHKEIENDFHLAIV
jgi:hypothetical protein